MIMPIWDGLQTLVKARGMENGIFLVTSSYGDPSFVQDPKAPVQALSDQAGFSLSRSVLMAVAKVGTPDKVAGKSVEAVVSKLEDMLREVERRLRLSVKLDTPSCAS